MLFAGNVKFYRQNNFKNRLSNGLKNIGFSYKLSSFYRLGEEEDFIKVVFDNNLLIRFDAVTKFCKYTNSL